MIKIEELDRYPIMELEMTADTGVFRTSIYKLEIKLDSWDKKTKDKFMSGDIFRDSELRDHAKTVLKKHGLKEAHIASGWETEIRGLQGKMNDE